MLSKLTRLFKRLTTPSIHQSIARTKKIRNDFDKRYALNLELNAVNQQKIAKLEQQAKALSFQQNDIIHAMNKLKYI